MTATVQISTTTYSTTHEGVTQTRKSRTMSYTHAVWAWKAGSKRGEDSEPGVMRWSQSVDAAHSFAQTLGNKGWTTAIEDVEVAHEAKARPAKVEKAAPAVKPVTVKPVKPATVKPAAKVAVLRPAKPAKVVPNSRPMVAEPAVKPVKAVKAKAVKPVKVTRLADGRIDHTGHDHAMTTWGRRQCQRAAMSGRFAETD